MSLLRKTLLYLLLASVPVVIGGGWLFHTIIYRGIQYEIDEQLSSDLAFVRRQLAEGQTLTGRYPLNNPAVEQLPATPPLEPVFSDTLEFDWRENQPVPVRRLTTTVSARGQSYRVVVKQAMGEFYEIARFLSWFVTGGFVVLLGLLVLLNGWVSRRLWKPFYRLSDALRNYRLDAPTPPTFPGSTIAEFNAVSTALNEMSQNLHRQYRAQKEFTDHAAHEMQTPLASVMAQLDSLLGTEPLSSEQVALMEQAQRAVRRSANLNKGLLLLTKIENRQYAEREEVDVTALISGKLEALADWIEHKRLRVSTELSASVRVPMNPHLADILVTNLLTNAIRHSEEGGQMRLWLSGKTLELTNSGPAPTVPVETLWERFRKSRPDSDSPGLGLALVREIAQTYGFTSHYGYADGWHRLKIGF